MIRIKRRNRTFLEEEGFLALLNKVHLRFLSLAFEFKLILLCPHCELSRLLLVQRKQMCE